MKKWCLIAISLLGVAMVFAGIITDEKIFYLLGSATAVLVSGIMLWQTYRKK